MKNKRVFNFLIQQKVIIIIIVILFFIYRLPIDFVFFQGLEYEDSYLANSISRFLTYNRNTADATFLANTCAIGSLVDCNISLVHSGNLIGLPSIVWGVNEIFGYKVNNIALVNLVFSLISSICIFIFCYKINKDYLFGLIASIVFITTPIFNSFQSSSLFETSSSSLIMLSLLLYVIYFEGSRSDKYRFHLFVLMLIVNLFSLHFKRENIIIVSFPFIFIIIKWLRYKCKFNFYHILKEQIPYLIFLVGLILYYIYVLDINRSLDIERNYAIGNSFQFKFFPPLFMMFVKGFSTFNWFSFYPIFTLIGIIYIIFSYKNKPLLLYALFLFLGLVLINTIHHRSYYFVRSGMVTAFDSLRHINMLSPYFSIITGFGIYKLILVVKSRKVKNTKLKLLLFPFGFLMLVYLLLQSYSTRDNLVEIEKYNRILPMTELRNIVDQNNHNKDLVITDQSVLLHNYSQENLLIIDFTMLSNYFNEKDINSLLNDHNIYLLWKDYFSEEIFRNRYDLSFKLLKKFDMSIVEEGENFRIVKLKKKISNNKDEP